MEGAACIQGGKRYNEEEMEEEERRKMREEKRTCNRSVVYSRLCDMLNQLFKRRGMTESCETCLQFQSPLCAQVRFEGRVGG